MGSVLSTPKTFVLLIIGLDDAGKTSLVNRLKRRELPRGVLPATTPTAGFTRETFSHGQHSVTVLEYSGSEKMRPLWRCTFWNGHAFIFLIDATAPTRFPEAKQELIRLSEETSDLYPILVLANKIDLADAVELSTIKEAFDVSGLAKSGRKAAFKGISAMTGEGVDEALECR
ncbi:ADP-ribosylation factor family-domain-containing protein [Mycena sanguinolenta]|nr:ADP-ribosylation factor family-domain-containing protein [Mycena sanguinolenta]